MTKEDWEKIQAPFIKALTAAIIKSAEEDPEGFKAWMKSLQEGP